MPHTDHPGRHLARDADCDDWSQHPEMVIAERAISAASPGALLLHHDALAGNPLDPACHPTLDGRRIVELIVDGLASQGFRCVSLSQLLRLRDVHRTLWFVSVFSFSPPGSRACQDAHRVWVSGQPPRGLRKHRDTTVVPALKTPKCSRQQGSYYEPLYLFKFATTLKSSAGVDVHILASFL